MLSPLQRGPAGRFAVAVEPAVNLETTGTTCSFFEIDVFKAEVKQQTMALPSRMLLKMQPYFDVSRQRWTIALKGAGWPGLLDIYEVSDENSLAWKQLFTARHFDLDAQVDNDLIAFWQQGNAFPLLLSEPDASQLSDAALKWTQWRSTSTNPPFYQDLGTAYRWIPYVWEEGCLLFTCQCVAEQSIPATIPQQIDDMQWRFMCAAYRHDGTLLYQNSLPRATLPVRDRHLVSNDLFHWLVIAMNVVDGPHDGAEGRKTCLAVLTMHDHPELLGEQVLLDYQRQQSQGGVYCIDLREPGRWRYLDMKGEQISLCACGEQVVGTVRLDGQLCLWRWLPFQEAPKDNFIPLASSMLRAMVVARDARTTLENEWFWCVEEYEHGIRVVQRTGHDLQETRSFWCEGVSLPDRWYSPRMLEAQSQYIVALQESLLILAMNQDSRLQLLQFQ